MRNIQRNNAPNLDPAALPDTADMRICWPRKYDLFGVQVSATDYAEAVGLILRAASTRTPAVVSFQAVHAIVTACQDPALREMVNEFEMIGPDGQPVRWALNCLHGTRLKDRVYGPELTRHLCAGAAELGMSVYFYGSSPHVVARLQTRMQHLFPKLIVAGAESPPYRPLTPREDAAVVERINVSGASLVFVGLGAPKQDVFAYQHRGRIQAVQVCVGAAFDFLAGEKPMAPPWMQRSGLEWLFRLIQEPGRLWKRYLVTNSLFICMLVLALGSRLWSRRHDQVELEPVGS
jgi:exopolysaccharide biosynthesis WecB/TagA/CpsF family protein